MTTHACSHPPSKHRRMGWGRCLVPSCLCVVGPGPAVRAARPEPKPRGTVTVDANGLVVDFTPPERVSDRQRLERMLWDKIEESDLPMPVKQFYWARPERMFRSDFAYPAERILLEVQGGIWAADPGRHNRGSGYEADLSRANLAALMGWKLLAFSERMIKSDEAVSTIQRALAPSPERIVAEALL